MDSEDATPSGCSTVPFFSVYINLDAGPGELLLRKGLFEWKGLLEVIGFYVVEA